MPRSSSELDLPGIYVFSHGPFVALQAASCRARALIAPYVTDDPEVAVVPVDVCEAVFDLADEAGVRTTIFG